MTRGLPVARISASGPATDPGVAETVAMLIDVSTCIGCKACEVACVEWNDLQLEPLVQERVLNSYQTMPDMTPAFWNVIKFDEIAVDEARRPMSAASEGAGVMLLMRKDMCMHCADPGCLAACPSEGAIVQYENGVVDFVQDACIGCGYCMTGCPFDVPKFDATTHRVYKCTMCSDRLEDGHGPACVKACPTGCLQFGTKDEMKVRAEHRVAQLVADGFPNAGVYDPTGVGGTGVITILHHADQPELYGGLPANPRVDPAVRMWQGPVKLAGNVGLSAAVLVSIGHFLGVGPSRPTEATHEPRVRRYALSERALHWTVAGSFLYLTATGLGFWSPHLAWLLTLVGGGQTARWAHPWVGLLFVIAVGLQGARWWRDLRAVPGDRAFVDQLGRYLAGAVEGVPRSGRFNAGQKLLFGTQLVLALLLLISGVPLWWPETFDRSIRLVSLVVHPIAGVVAIASLMAHVHMALLITRGGLRAMTEGTVSRSWARHHHADWSDDQPDLPEV